MQKRILIVSNMYPSGDQIMYGVYIRNIEEALQRHGFDVSRVAIAGRGKSLIDKLLKYLKFYKTLFRINTAEFDIIDVSYPSHSFIPFFFRRRGSAKYIVRLHGHDLVPVAEETLYFRVVRLLSRMACKRADGVIVPSEFFRRELLRFEPGLKNPILTLPVAGVDPEQFCPKKHPVSSTRRDICFGYVGRLDPMKGVELFIRALARQPDNVQGLIVGDGPHGDRLRELSDELGIAHRCRFVGAIPYDQLPEYYNQMDALVFPTLYRESFGLVMIEAMACGVPVITTDHGATGDFVADGMDGYKVPPGDLEALVAAMLQFAGLAPDERARLAENAGRKAGDYTVPAIIGRYREFLGGI